jgi:hypothetical protein
VSLALADYSRCVFLLLLFSTLSGSAIPSTSETSDHDSESEMTAPPGSTMMGPPLSGFSLDAVARASQDAARPGWAARRASDSASHRRAPDSASHRRAPLDLPTASDAPHTPQSRSAAGHRAINDALVLHEAAIEPPRPTGLSFGLSIASPPALRPVWATTTGTPVVDAPLAQHPTDFPSNALFRPPSNKFSQYSSSSSDSESGDEGVGKRKGASRLETVIEIEPDAAIPARCKCS